MLIHRFYKEVITFDGDNKEKTASVDLSTIEKSDISYTDENNILVTRHQTTTETSLLPPSENKAMEDGNSTIYFIVICVIFFLGFIYVVYYYRKEIKRFLDHCLNRIRGSQAPPSNEARGDYTF